MMSQTGRESARAITRALRELPAPIFAAAWGQGREGRQLFVHVAAAPGRAVLRRQIEAALSLVGVERPRIRFHEAAQRPRSLERLTARFAGDEVVYDPTDAVARAKSLVLAGHAVRASLSQKLIGLYYAPRLRTFFVALKAARLAHGEKIKVGALAEIETSVRTAMKAAFAGASHEMPAVRVGFGLPAANLVAVDHRSVVGFGARVSRALRRLWKPVTIAALFGFGLAGTAAADGSNGGRAPAVSETNLKIVGQGGVVDDDSAWVAGGLLTLPLGERFGLQVEGGAAGIDDDTIWGGAAHLFTRDPDRYLLGLFAAYGKEDEFDLDATRIGAEAELYLNQISILAQAGYQFSDGFNGNGGDTAFGSIDLRWYATDNLAFTAGGNFQEEVSQARLQAEFMPGFSALPGLAFNVTGVIGDDDYDSVLGGITYYFGSNASLKDRHRRQDPDSALFNLFQSVQQERAKLDAIYGTSQQGPQ